MFNAIGWCFFKQETQQALKSKELTEEEKFIPNENSYNSDGISKVEVEVTLQFPEDSEVYQATVSRRAIFKKGIRDPISWDNVEINAYDIYNTLVDIDKRNFLDFILPQSLAGFYMLDAEWLKSYGTQTSIRVSDGIQLLFRLDSFIEIGNALSTLTERYNKKRFAVKSKSQKYESLRNDLETFYKSKNSLEQDIKEKESEKNKLLSETDEVEQEAGKLSQMASLFADYKKWQDRRNLASSEIAKIDKEYMSIKISKAFLLNSTELLESVLSSMKGISNDPFIKLPPEVESVFIENLLRNNKCICGRPVNQGTHEHDTLSGILKKSSESEKNLFLNEVPYKIETAKSIIEETEIALKKYDEDRGQKVREFEEAEKQMSDLHKRASQDLDTLEDLSTRYSSLMSKFVRYSQEVGQLEGAISQKKKELDELGLQIQQIEGKLEDERDLSGEEAVWLFRSTLASVLKEACEQFADSAKIKFASLLEEGLNKLLKASPGFEDFSVSIEAVQGGKVLRFHYKEAGSEKYYLSGGQAEFVGIIIMVSFIKLLERFKKQSRAVPFVLMDNPLHDLDKDNKKRVYENLSSFFEGTQVVVFMPDETYNSIKEYSHNGLCKVFIAKYDKSTKTTSVKEIGGDLI